MKMKKERRRPPTLTVKRKRMALHLMIRKVKVLSLPFLRMQSILTVKRKKTTLILMSVILLNWVFQVRLPLSLC